MDNKRNANPQEYIAPLRADQPETSNQDFDYPTDADKPIANEFPEPDWSENNPIPVYVVERPEIPQVLNWSSERFLTVDTGAVQIAGSRRNRTRMVIRNEGPDPVFVDPEASVMAAFSFRIAANEDLELLHNASVWARCDVGKSATVSVAQEYTVELDKHHV